MANDTYWVNPKVVDLDWLYINGKISETYYKQQLELLNKEETNG